MVKATKDDENKRDNSSIAEENHRLTRKLQEAVICEEELRNEISEVRGEKEREGAKEVRGEEDGDRGGSRWREG